MALLTAHRLEPSQAFRVSIHLAQNDYIRRGRNRPAPGERPDQMTESFATASYFTNREGAAPEVGTVFLDIGGGTSDISISQSKQPRYQVSIRCAGRDIFLAPLFQRRKDVIPKFAKVNGFSRETADRLI